MRQRWLLIFILLGVALLLTVSVFYTLEKEKPVELPKLTDLEANRIISIHIERKDAQPISLLKKQPDIWQMTMPYHLPGNHIRINRLLKMLSARQYKPLEMAELNLAELKLDEPLATVKFNQLTVAFGDRSPINNGQRYMLIKQKVYLLADTAYQSLNDNALAFVSLSPLGNNPKITALKMPGYSMVLKEGQWHFTSTTLSSDEIDTSQDALNTFIDNWQRLQAFSVEAYTEGSDETSIQGEIDISLLDQAQTLHLTIMSTQQTFVLGRNEKGVQYQLPISQADKLLHLPTKSQAEKN